MSEFSRQKASPRIDLETLRETLAYMESDTRNDPGLGSLSRALSAAIAEIDRLRPASANDNAARYAPRFFPARGDTKKA